ncbi:MAG: peptidoglycan-binding protein [Yoonia sp.]|nr:peptidoglycan-binding protein [Yoonia sp.]
MQTVNDIAAAILAREGGYVNDPDDPGGATNHGVTVHTMRRLGLDLNGDGKVDVADVRVLSADRALQIFIDEYFHRPGIDALPAALQPSVFDMYVNAGNNAVKILQRLLNQMRISVTVDGAIGPHTAAAAAQALNAAPNHFVDAYGIARRNYYYALADGRPASRKYARTRKGGKGGWIKRAEDFVADRYHLSEDAHRARTAKWG